MINKANEKSVAGDYVGALYVTQEALKVAEEINGNDEKDSRYTSYPDAFTIQSSTQMKMQSYK